MTAQDKYAATAQRSEHLTRSDRSRAVSFSVEMLNMSKNRNTVVLTMGKNVALQKGLILQNRQELYILSFKSRENNSERLEEISCRNCVKNQKVV